MRLTLALLAVVVISGCAQLVHLNDSTKSKPDIDVANLLAPREIPYETQEKDSIAVSYNLFVTGGRNFSGYRLTLIFRNNGSATKLITPRVALRDAAGFEIAPYAYEAFVAQAASLAGTSIPATAIAPTQYYHSGTIRDQQTGRTTTFTGQSTPSPAGGFAGGFAQGLSQGAAIAAVANRNEGRVMLRWANSFWLKSAYELPPGGAASGALFFPAAHVGRLPLRLTVDVGERMEFVTTSTQ